MKENNQKNSLDNTLRYVYNTFRNCKVSVAIEFTHGGRTWRADTPEEAIALRKQLEVESAEHGAVWEFEQNWIWTPDLVMDLLNNAGTRQSEFLEMLNRAETVLASDAMGELCLGPMAFAGVLSGLSKQLKKLGLKPWNLYRVEVDWMGKQKTRTFRLSNEFRSAASEIGWPENWRKKDDVNSGATR